MGGGNSKGKNSPVVKETKVNEPNTVLKSFRKRSVTRHQEHSFSARRHAFGSSTRNVIIESLEDTKISAHAAICEGKGFESVVNSRRHTLSFRIAYVARSSEARNSSPFIISTKEHKEFYHLANKKISSMRVKAYSDGVDTFQRALEQELENENRYIFFGVVEGHGVYAETIASYVRLFLRSKLRNIGRNVNVTPDYAERVLRNSVIELTTCINNGDIGADMSESGCVFTVVYYGQQTLVTCSIGDAKCVVFKQHPETLETKIEEVTPNHTWHNPDEYQRAIDHGYNVRINTLDNVGQIGKKALFFNKASQKPGISMSRIVGYTSVSEEGLSHEAEIRRVMLDVDGWKIDSVILASNGLWNVTSNKELKETLEEFRAHQRIASYVDAQELSERLIHRAADKWANLWTDNSMQVEAFYPDLFESFGVIPCIQDTLGDIEMPAKRMMPKPTTTPKEDVAQQAAPV